MKQLQKWSVSSLFFTALMACDGSSEGTVNNFDLVLTVTGGTLNTGRCNSTQPITNANGLIFVNKTILTREQSDTADCVYQPSGNDNVLGPDGASFKPFDSQNRIVSNEVFVSFPEAKRIVKFSETRDKVWLFGLEQGGLPDPLLKIPTSNVPTDKNFCPAQIVLSDANLPASSSPSEGLLAVLDDPAACTNSTSNRTPRVAIINANDGSLQGFFELGFFTRSNSPIRIAATNSTVFMLGANAGSQYIVARVPLADIGKTSPAPVVSISEPLTGNLSSSLTRPLTLGVVESRVFAGIGDSGRSIEVVNDNTNRVAFAPSDVLTGDAGSNPVGGSRLIFWNRSNGATESNPNLTLFARDNDIFTRRTLAGGAPQNETVSSRIIDAIYPSVDNAVWGLRSSNNTDGSGLIRIDPFPASSPLTISFPEWISNITVSSISWLIPTNP
jgi:hypothetical protein